jgi:very-short-patch-repair endonuclease
MVDQDPPRDGEGDRAKRGGGDSRFVARPVVKRARELRKNLSLPERLLWQRLRLCPAGLKFRRQHPIGPYIADFCCLSARWIIELDGFAHDAGGRPERDATRTRFLQENGYKVLRIAAQLVLQDADGTADAIVARVANPLHRPADGPPPRTGEEF